MFNRVAFVVALAAAVFCRAGDPFIITAQTTSGTPQTLIVSGHSLPNLVTDLVKSQSAFSSLQNRDTTATFTYGGVPNTIIITKNAANTSATLVLPGIGFTKTFTGKNENDLEHQIKNFAKKNGADVYGRFIQSLGQTTDIGVTDGNPLAGTAVFANQAYLQFGFNPTPFQAPLGNGDPLEQVATPNIRVDINGGYVHTDTTSSYYVGGAFSSGVKFGDRVGLVFTTPFEYRNVEGGAVYDLAEEVSLPIVIIKPQGKTSLSWMVTPTGIGGGAGSVDLAAGGLFAGGSLTSSLSLNVDTFVFTLADQFNYFKGFPVSVGDYKFETHLEQEIFKNGLKVTKFFGDSLFVDVGGTYTNFMRTARVSSYWTPSAGIGLRLGYHAAVQVSYSGDFGRDYAANGGNVLFYFNY